MCVCVGVCMYVFSNFFVILVFLCLSYSCLLGMHLVTHEAMMIYLGHAKVMQNF